MGGGCLWSLVPLLILFPLYAVIREPLIYILHESKDIVQVIIQECSAEGAGLIEGIKTAKDGYAQLIIAGRLFDNPELAQQIVAATADKLPEGTEIAARTLQGMDFSFLGIDLSAKPEYNIFNKEVWSWNWAHIGAFLLPVLATLSQVATMLISQKVNNSLVTNEKGIQDKEAAKNSQANQSTKALTYTMPLMTLFFGFGMPAALSLKIWNYIGWNSIVFVRIVHTHAIWHMFSKIIHTDVHKFRCVECTSSVFRSLCCMRCTPFKCIIFHTNRLPNVITYAVFIEWVPCHCKIQVIKNAFFVHENLT